MSGGYMFRTYQNYVAAFYAAGILAVIAFLSIMIAKRPAPIGAQVKA